MNEEIDIRFERKRLILAATIPAIILLICWLIKLFEISSGISLSNYGVLPRNLHSLFGIILMPLLHGDYAHLAANSVAFLVLGTGVFYFYRDIAVKVLLFSWLSTGIITWVIGRESYHIGASGLVYAFAGFIFLSGVLRNHFRLMAISLLVVFLYGSMIWGIFPIEPNISWEGHLSGLFTGFVLALIYRSKGPQRPRYSWEEEDDEDDVNESNNEKGAPSNTSATHRISPEYDYKPNENKN
ncbi:MAG: rhomboid family intramembrane serine protease [Bacteroidales bacterium]|nr:rhomboid family intramembrane serine protease [Bacteroidales bacterium]HOY38443.1 rhomboid family intramembrane serine protease [Bacteroidales bacterium]HQP03134.1 rhomboid family intramembrane serine protease [Bacteroidales bacterium]